MSRRARGRALRRRYGCFRLPHVPGAKKVACAGGSKSCEGPRISRSHAPVTWLARTDPAAKTVEFSDAFDTLTPKGKRYITAHEQAHLIAGPDHNDRFYDALKKLIVKYRLDWRTAWELERFNYGRKN